MTMPRMNGLGQPVGAPVPGWTRRELPQRTPMKGRFCTLEPLALAHADALHAANSLDVDGRNWTYLFDGPFASVDEYREWVAKAMRTDDPLFYAIVNAQGQPVGVGALMRIDPAHGVIEIGHLHFSRSMQRTPIGTEAIYLMLRRAFDELGYRRVEWKCDSLNAPSRAAALRFGFTYEGLFRQAVIYKGRNRDTTWFSIVDAEWPARRAAYEHWLAPANFDADGRQRRKLAASMPRSPNS